jgi:hypothetical protein
MAADGGGVLLRDELVGIQPREIGADEYVSHYGSRLTGEVVFRDQPRTQDTGALSVILGKVTPAEARRRVRKAGEVSGDDGVRYALVGDLRAQGFAVTHAPRAGNTLHARVGFDGAWDDGVAGKFNQCFGAPQWYQEESEGAGSR